MRTSLGRGRQIEQGNGTLMTRLPFAKIAALLIVLAGAFYKWPTTRVPLEPVPQYDLASATREMFWEMASARGIGRLQRWRIEGEVAETIRLMSDAPQSNSVGRTGVGKRQILEDGRRRVLRHVGEDCKEWWEQVEASDWLFWDSLCPTMDSKSGRLNQPHGLVEKVWWALTH